MTSSWLNSTHRFAQVPCWQEDVILLKEIHHVLISDIHIGISTQTSVFFNGGLPTRKSPFDLLLNRGEVVPQKQRCFRLTAAHFVPGHADCKMVVGGGGRKQTH